MMLALSSEHRGYILAAINSYYDGRGSLEHPDDHFCTVLVGLAANSDTWEAFHNEWMATINPLTNDNPLSVTDCLSGQGDFRGIPEDQCHAAISQAGLLIGQWTRKGVTSYATVVVLDDYQRLVAEGVPLVSVEAICVDDIVPVINHQYPNSDDRFELYFDRNERFLHEVNRYWKASERKRRYGPYCLRRVARIGTASDTYSGIQAADVYSWTISTYARRVWLKDRSVYIPPSLSGVVADPPNSTHRLDYETLRHPRYTVRTIASTGPIPDWSAVK